MCVIPDITFVGGTLFGVENTTPSIVTISTLAPTLGRVTPGAVTILIPPAVPGTGGALAHDPNGVVPVNFAWMNQDVNPIHYINVGLGTVVPGPTLAGFTMAGKLTAATYHKGTLYVVDGIGPGAGPRELFTVAPVTGIATPVLGMQPIIFSNLIGAIASPTK